MTENRKNWLYPEASGLYFQHDGFVMRATDGKQYDIDEECELLNEYHKEYNECRNDVLRLEKENEQLKEEIDYLKAKNGNQQVIKEVLKLLEEEVDLFSDKAIEHDISAYIELRELDNKDAYYMAISTKKAIKLLKEMM